MNIYDAYAFILYKGRKNFMVSVILHLITKSVKLWCYFFITFILRSFFIQLHISLSLVLGLIGKKVNMIYNSYSLLLLT
jgi:hypothetical protein